MNTRWVIWAVMAIAALNPGKRAMAAQQNAPTPPPPATQAPAPPDTSAADNPFTLRSESNVVFVPTTVRTKKGDMLYELKAGQFTVTDNGVPQKVSLDEDTDALGLSLVVVIQCSRSAVLQFAREEGLATMIDGLVGGAPRQVAVVNYSDTPELFGRFSSDPEDTQRALNKLTPCEEPEAVTYDAVKFAAEMLAKRNDHSRHAILLVSETRDHGSKTRASQVVSLLGRTNTVLDAVSFAPGLGEIKDSLFHGQMGPGVFGLLAMAVQAMRTNAPKTLASLSGGEYQTFDSQISFDRNLIGLSNRIHNYYLLSFQTPATAPPGLHRIEVKIPDYPDAKIRSRESFWVGPPPDQPIPGDEPAPEKDSKKKP